MPPIEEANLIALEIAGLAVFAGIGGALAYILRELEEERVPKLSHCLAEFAASAFVGMIAGLICEAMQVTILWATAIAGVFGWMGAESSIQVLSKVVRSKLGVPK